VRAGAFPACKHDQGLSRKSPPGERFAAVQRMMAWNGRAQPLLPQDLRLHLERGVCEHRAGEAQVEAALSRPFPRRRSGVRSSSCTVTCGQRRAYSSRRCRESAEWEDRYSRAAIRPPDPLPARRTRRMVCSSRSKMSAVSFEQDFARCREHHSAFRAREQFLAEFRSSSFRRGSAPAERYSDASPRGKS
jgi:hypothetical protein